MTSDDEHNSQAWRLRVNRFRRLVVVLTGALKSVTVLLVSAEHLKTVLKAFFDR